MCYMLVVTNSVVRPWGQRSRSPWDTGSRHCTIRPGLFANALFIRRYSSTQVLWWRLFFRSRRFSYSYLILSTAKEPPYLCFGSDDRNCVYYIFPGPHSDARLTSHSCHIIPCYSIPSWFVKNSGVKTHPFPQQSSHYTVGGQRVTSC